MDSLCEKMAALMTDHTAHVHCSGCGACLPSTSQWYHQWCASCRTRIWKALPIGALCPWDVYQRKGEDGATAVAWRSFPPRAV